VTTRTSPPNGVPCRAEFCTSDGQGHDRFDGTQFTLRANNG
jgi:hypothetical protein